MKKHFLLLLMAFMSFTAWAQQDISGCTVQLSGDGLYTYDGTAKTVGLVVKVATASTAIDASGYDVVYYAEDGTTAVAASALIPAGNYFAAAKGKETAGYTGETTKLAFTINRRLMTSATSSTGGITVTPTPSVASASFSYDGTEKKFTSVTVTYKRTSSSDPVTLTENVDYTISYENNINAGLATDANGPKLVVTGIGNFQGDNKTGFAISAATLPTAATAGAYTFTALTTNPVYTGEETTTLPKLVVVDGEKTLAEGTDYEIRWQGAATGWARENTGTSASPVWVYHKPVKADTYTAFVYGKGGYAEGTGESDASWTVTIDQAPITVSVKDIEVAYNGNNQSQQNAKVRTAGQLEFSGILSADASVAAGIKADIDYSKAVACYTADGTTVGEAIVPGTYVLSVDKVKMKTTLSEPKSANYKIGTYNKGKLIIIKKKLELQAANATKAVGEADPEFTLTATATGISTDEIQGVTITRENKSEEVGEYDLTPSWSAAKVIRDKGLTTEKEVTDYYEFALATTKGKLTIGKGGILVTIKDAAKFYGQADPAKFEYTVTGLQDGDELPAFTITRSEGEEVGTYSLTATVTNPKPEKYATLNVSNGIFTINKAQLTITLPAQNLKNNDLATALKKDGITVTGINNTDVAADLYTLTFNVTGLTTDGSIPTTDTSDGTANGSLTATNATYNNGYKLTLNSAVAPATKGAIDRYEILVKAATATTDAVYGSSITGKIIVGTGDALAINFTSVNTDYATITDQAGETQNVTLTMTKRKDREVPAGTKHNWAAQTWNTMILPFEVSVADLSRALGYAIVNVLDPSKTALNDKGKVNVGFKLEMGTIPANTPFCVKTSTAIASDRVNTFPNAVKIVAPAGKSVEVQAGEGDFSAVKFIGVYEETTINSSKPAYFLRGDNPNWAHISATSGSSWTIAPFEAYITMPAPYAARGVIFTFEELDGTTTAIQAVEASVNEGNSVKAGWYTIGGVKLQSAPTQKGIYINNGKKVIVK